MASVMKSLESDNESLKSRTKENGKKKSNRSTGKKKKRRRQ